MDKYDWSRLTHLQVGRFAEYFVKMEFTLYGFDVYQAEVDDKGIDFVIRKGITVILTFRLSLFAALIMCSFRNDASSYAKIC